MTTLGVLADTHIPDRAPRLNPRVKQVFQGANVKAILHAGDVSVPRVLEELGQVAPVYAVRGNRDVFYLRNLPLQIQLDFEGVAIGMTHGHGTFSRYMIDRLILPVRRRMVEQCLQRVLHTFPQADVIIFGHLHMPFNFHRAGKLLFNPGSSSYPQPRSEPPSIGLLHIDPPGKPRGEIIPLK